MALVADGIINPIAFRLGPHGESIGKGVLKPQAKLVVRIILAGAGIGHEDGASSVKGIFSLGVIQSGPAERRKLIGDGQNSNQVKIQAFQLDIEFFTNEEKIVKTRYVDDKYNHQILRVDRHEILAPLQDDLSLQGFDAIVISDYDKGFISDKKLFQLTAQAICPVFIDTKKKLVPDKENCFIKLNEVEYKNLSFAPLNIITTLGDKGAMYKNIRYPSAKVTVFDVVGAGDTFLAALTYFYLVLGCIELAIPFANKASSIAVQHTGTYVLTAGDIESIKLN